VDLATVEELFLKTVCQLQLFMQPSWNFLSWFQGVSRPLSVTEDTKIKEGVDVSLLFKKSKLSFEGPVIIWSLWFDRPLFPFPSSQYPTGGKE